MFELKPYKLKDIATVQTGPFGSQLHQSDYQLKGTPIITVEHLGENKIVHNNLPLVSDADKERLNKYTLKEGDIVFSRVGSVDRRAYVGPNEDGWMFSGRCLRVRINKKEADPKYLSYYFGQESFKEHIRMIAVGATMPSINTDILSNVEVSLPDISYQHAIAETLSSLDDKIDLLTNQNNAIEDLAICLFRERFYSSENKAVALNTFVLSELFDIGIGRTPPRKEKQWFSTNPNDIKWVSIKDMGNNGIYIDNTAEYLTNEAVDKFNVPIIPENTVLLSFKMTVGRLGITTEKMLSNEAIAHFKPKDGSPIFPEYLYLFFKAFRFETLGTTSSIVDAINSQMIKGIEIEVPDITQIQQFKNEVEPYFEKIKFNSRQIKTLTQLRDNLLPKLMSGEASIKMN